MVITILLEMTVSARREPIITSFVFFYSIWVFIHEHSRITGLQGKRKGIFLTSHYDFHTLHRHLDISLGITAESSPLHIAESRTRTGNIWFQSASCQPPSYGPFSAILQTKDLLDQFSLNFGYFHYF